MYEPGAGLGLEPRELTSPADTGQVGAVHYASAPVLTEPITSLPGSAAPTPALQRPGPRTLLSPGDPAPWFTGRCTHGPRQNLDGFAGHYIVLCFFGSGGNPNTLRMLEEFAASDARFASQSAGFCGVSIDPDDERLGRLEPLRQRSPRVMFFWDFDQSISHLYGAAAAGGSGFVPHTLIIDPALRVRAVLRMDSNVSAHVNRIMAALEQMPPLSALTGFAPVLTIPFVFEPEFCRMLIGLYEKHGGRDIGTVSEINGQTVRVHDPNVKRRNDYQVTDPSLIAAIQSRIARRVVPEIRKSFQFNATRVERYLVACYDAQSGGHFRAHRDDTTKGSAHRRFAVTINLNSDEYEGGDLRFPEFGVLTYRGPTGSAIVFSCSMMHEVRPVTRGKRYAFLPFLYDEQAARIRKANQQFMADDLRLPSDRLEAATL